MTELATTPPQTQFKILLIGDVCIDEYKYGNVTRISPEAPVPVFVPDTHILKDGMAGNVKNNLESLGCKVTLKSNTDSEGKISKKTRYIDKKSKQHIVRIDEDRQTQALEISAFDNLDYNAIVISDYDKGAVSYDLIEWLRKQYSGPIFIDTKKTDLARFEGCYIKINKLERRQAHTLPSSKYVIVTHGDNGAIYDEEHYSGIKAGDVTDVCGAGDTFLAALAYKFIETNDIRTAIKFANKAASITVQHLGVYAPSLGEIE